MADSNALIIFIVVLFYLVTASAFVALVNDSDGNNIFPFGADYIYNSNKDFTNTNYTSSDFTFTAHNANVIQNGNGIGINKTSDDGYVKFKFTDDILAMSSDNIGYFTYIIQKTGNEKISFYFNDRFTIPDWSFYTENNNLFYNPNLYTYEEVYTNVGNTFSYKFEYDEQNKLYKIYCNDVNVKILDYENFNFVYVKNEIQINDNDVYIQSIDTSSQLVESDTGVFSSISAYANLIFDVLAFGIPDLFWFFNLLLIRLPEFILIVAFIKLII